MHDPEQPVNNDEDFTEITLGEILTLIVFIVSVITLLAWWLI